MGSSHARTPPGRRPGRRDLPKLALPAQLSAEQPVYAVYWRPNEAFIDELVDALRGKRVLEVFAGNGFLAATLSARGIDVLATSVLSSMDGHEMGLYHPIIEMDAEEAVTSFHRERDTLLMCWPTVTHRALAAAESWTLLKGPGGADLVYVGEVTNYEKGHLAGCATDDFHARFRPSKVFRSYRGNELELACLGELEMPSLDPRAARKLKPGFGS